MDTMDKMAIRKREYHAREDADRELTAAQVKLSAKLGARMYLILRPVLYMTLEEIEECEEYLAETPPDLAAVREVFDEARTRYPKFAEEKVA